MKIICVEEHTSDQDLFKAGQPKQESEARYFMEVGADFKGSLDDGDDKLPSTVSFEVSTKLLPDLDGGRLALMDEHGIDMQILSYSNPSQNAPADQQVQLRQRNTQATVLATDTAATPRQTSPQATPATLTLVSPEGTRSRQHSQFVGHFCFRTCQP